MVMVVPESTDNENFCMDNKNDVENFLLEQTPVKILSEYSNDNFGDENVYTCYCYRTILENIFLKLFKLDVIVLSNSERVQYRINKREETNVMTVFLTIFLYLSYFVIYMLSLCYNYRINEEEIYFILDCASIAIGIIACLSGVFIILSRQLSPDSKILSVKNKLYLFESVFYLGLIISLCLHTLSQIMNGGCPDESRTSFLDSILCNPYSQLNMIPESSSMLLIATPLIIQCIIQSIPCGIFYIGISISYLWVVFLVIYLQAVNSIFFLLFCSLFIIAVINIKYKDMNSFADKIKEKVKALHNLETEKNDAMNKESELRIMIANVSHDLKTVIIHNIHIETSCGFLYP